MTIFDKLHELTGIPTVIAQSLFVVVLLLAAAFVVRGQLAKADGGVMPDEGITLRNTFELLLEMLVSQLREIIGPEGLRYLPVVGTIFFFILLSNLLGLIPGVGGPTASINTTLSWGIISFLTYQAVGIHKHGFWYINQFLGPSLFEKEIGGRHIHFRLLLPLFLPMEIILHLARAGTLALRLLANMFADHTALAVWTMLVPIAVPVIFMSLGLLVAFVQAFLFALLTIVYIKMALDEAH